MRICIAAFLVAVFAAPLVAADEPLIAELWPDPSTKVKDIVERAEVDLLVWLSKLAEEGSPAETHFDDGVSYLVEGVNARTRVLTIRKRMLSWDQDGKRIYIPLPEVEQRHIMDWPSRYAVITFAADKNPDDRAVIAFAFWLYERRTRDRDSRYSANRVAAIVHDRNEKLRPAIEAWVLERDFKGKGDAVELCKLWDGEFRKQRSVLLTADAREKEVTEKEKAAKAEHQRLMAEYRNVRARSATLVEMITDLMEFRSHYAGTTEYAKNKDKLDKLGKELEENWAEVQKLMAEADKEAETARNLDSDNQGNKSLPHWKKAAIKYDEAYKKDIGSYPILTRVANAWLKAGNPHYVQNEGYMCTDAACMRMALPYWDKLTKVKPGDTDLMMNLGLCFQAIGKHAEADRVYTDVVKLEPSSTNGAEASRRIRDMQNPGEKREERERRRAAREDRARRDAEKGGSGD